MTDGNKLSNSRPFDVHRWSEHPALRELTNAVFAEIESEIPTRADQHDHRKHLRVLLLDLYHRYLEDAAGWIGLSLNRNKYSGPTRYKKLFLSFRPMRRLVSLLENSGHIEKKIGFRDRKTGVGYNSRIRSGERLRELFVKLEVDAGFAPFSEEIDEAHQEELVILRDKKKNDIDYKETDRTIAMRNQLGTYNEFLRGTYLDISLRGWPTPEAIDLTRKGLYRVFNNSSWEQGGRFYGGWWQGVSRDLRKRIVIGEHKTIEIDYSGLHMMLLYAREGIDYFGEIGADPYLNPDIFQLSDPNESATVRLREVLKKLQLTALNAENSQKAIQGAGQEIDRSILKEVGTSLPELLEGFTAFHAPIQDYFFSGIGVQLQYIDSLVTEEIINTLVLKERVPVLPIHDSYVCTVRDDQLLRDAVSNALDHVLAKQSWAKVTSKTKERLGEVYYDPKTETNDGFVTDDLEILSDAMDHDLESRRTHWRRTGEQAIVRYKPTQAVLEKKPRSTLQGGDWFPESEVPDPDWTWEP